MHQEHGAYPLSGVSNMSDVQWTVTEQNGSVSRPNAKKVQYVALQRTSDKMDNSQKEGVRVWNEMVQALRDNGLMEEKN